MYRHVSLLLIAIAPGLALGQTSAAQPAKLPKVVLIGDSIRMGFEPLVTKRLATVAKISSPKDNGGDSANVLKNLDAWVINEKPDVIHLNCGLHDLKLSKSKKTYQVDLAQYEKNLREIVQRIRAGTTARLVFASTTPIIDDRHAARKANFDRLEADVLRYNQVATRVMQELGVPVHDLHWVVEQGPSPKLLGKDGTHYTPAGYERLAEAVADCLKRQLTMVQYQPLKPAASGNQAAVSYQKDEAQRDALVPERYRSIKAPEFAIPESKEAWQKRRREVLRTVQRTLGDLPARPSPVRARIVSREIHSEFTLERVAIDNGVDGEVSALLILPTKSKTPVPAVLWLHSSSPDKTQILIPNTNGGAEPLGLVLVRKGYAVLSPDAYWHGDREGTGPAGSAETGRAEQESLHKLHLWQGRTLWGMFVRDDQVALDYLCARPEIDAKRIGATGMSMGSTRAWWLAAVDDRVAATVGVACLTRYENLIRHGQLRQHGVYYFVNGLLQHFDIEGVLALIAPRPYLALTGELDAGSPADGIRVIEDRLGRVYETLEARDRFRNVLYPGIGHNHTPEMRAETLAWFDRWLQVSQTR